MEHKKVMVVDDDEDIRTLVQTTLSLAGIDSDAAATAEEALERMNENLYSVVALDIHMPGMNGVELISRLKKISPLIQIIMLSSDSSMERVVECMDRGAVDFFTKETHQVPLMVEAIGSALGRGARWASWIGTHSGWNMFPTPEAVL